MYCCGVYGFININQFKKLAIDVLNSSYSEKELYMSILFTKMLTSNIEISSIYFSDAYHIGSLKEVENSLMILPKTQMRICFDLDNTLVTYPTIPGDYSTVKPIPRMIKLLNKLKHDGHIIIIYTARRMMTKQHNVGAVIKDIGYQTFKTLEDFNIPYDELLFGKPIADIYIDDRAINPYRNDIKSMGIIENIETITPINMLATNKYNSIEVKEKNVIKRGLTQYMKGELYFYLNIPKDILISKYFPKLYSYKNLDEDLMELCLENIKGVPLYTLYKHKLLNNCHIDQLFELMDCLHNVKADINIDASDIKANYIDKLKCRFAIIENYPYSNAERVQTIILSRLEKYLEKPTKIVPYIHGDLWFSNIILDFNNQLKIIDMKGQVNAKLTTNGDCMYDYGKFFQSIIGYDSILYNDSIDSEYLEDRKTYFLNKCAEREINIDDLEIITFSLIIGTLHAISDVSTRDRVWNWFITLLK